MDGRTPTQARKIPRGVFQKVGRKLEKFQGSLGLQTPAGSVQSLNELSDSYHERPEDAETMSLQYLPQQDTESPKAILRSKLSRKSDESVGLQRRNRPESSSSSNGRYSDIQQDPEMNPPVNDMTRDYDEGMKIICQKLLADEEVNLYDWRAFDKKVSLLRTAMSFNTPRVTTPVLIFLENTLSKSVFYDLLRKNQSALKNYLNLVKLRPNKNVHIDLLKEFECHKDVAMIYLQQVRETNDTRQKLAYLDQVAIELSSHLWWQTQIAEYQHLLHKQQELQMSLNLNQTNPVRLENRTVLETYKVVYQQDFRRQKQNRAVFSQFVERSQELEKAFHMSPEMVMCGKLSVIMQGGFRTNYDDFLHQAVRQGLFGKKYVISPENLADMVFNWVRLSGEGKELAAEHAGQFLNMISDPRRRVYFAEKFQNYNVAMDTIAQVLRDRGELEVLRKRIPQEHPAYQRATDLLETAKWRT